MANTNFDTKFSPSDGWVDLFALTGLAKTTQVTVTWQAFVAAGTQVVGDLTITATGAFTAAQVASVAYGSAVVAGLTSSGSNNWTIGPNVGNTNTLTSNTPNSAVAAPATSFTGAGNSAPTTVTNTAGAVNTALTIYNKGQQPFNIVISPTMPGKMQPGNVGGTPMGIPVYAGPIGSTLSISASVAGLWGLSLYENSYALLQN